VLPERFVAKSSFRERAARARRRTAAALRDDRAPFTASYAACNVMLASSARSAPRILRRRHRAARRMRLPYQRAAARRHASSPATH